MDELMNDEISPSPGHIKIYRDRYNCIWKLQQIQVEDTLTR